MLTSAIKGRHKMVVGVDHHCGTLNFDNGKSLWSEEQYIEDTSVDSESEKQSA